MIKRIAPIFLSTLVLLILFLVFWKSSSGPRFSQTARKMEMDMNMTDFSIARGGQGRLSWELSAEKAAFVREHGRFSLVRPEITYHGPENSTPMIITSSRGEILHRQNQISLWPDVRAVQDRLIIHSGRAVYHGREELIHLDEDVTFQGDDMVINSRRARIYPKKNMVVAEKNVRTRLH
ncbi:MAG: LPS export ABC transporter periplasmic protein LptC [Desulfonatronovibrionaceae bacterium]